MIYNQKIRTVRVFSTVELSSIDDQYIVLCTQTCVYITIIIVCVYIAKVNVVYIVKVV